MDVMSIGMKTLKGEITSSYERIVNNFETCYKSKDVILVQ